MAFDVGEVAVDDPRNRNDVRDALHPLTQNIVGDAERLEEASILRDGEEFFVGDGDHGVDGRRSARPCHVSACLHAALAFEAEGLRDHRDRKRAHFAGKRSDDGSCAGAGATAEAGGDEDHVRAFEGFNNFSRRSSRRGFAANLRVGAGAKAICQLHAQVGS